MSEAEFNFLSSYNDGLAHCHIPTHMHAGIKRYLINRIAPGDFLMSVLQNDLRRACAHADDTNRDYLYNYVQFFYSYAPSTAWGSPERVRQWLSAKPEEAA